MTGSQKYLSIYSPDYIGPLGATELALGGGAVWEPTSQQIIRINPARMPG